MPFVRVTYNVAVTLTSPPPPRRLTGDVPQQCRHARGEEIAAIVAYLASDDAGYVTGAGLNIDGGFAA